MTARCGTSQGGNGSTGTEKVPAGEGTGCAKVGHQCLLMLNTRPVLNRCGDASVTDMTASTNLGRGLAAADVRERNLASILRILRDTGPVSRSGLASRLGLSRSGMTPIVAELVDRGLVRESVGPTRRGRPPIMLSLTSDDLCIIGVELRRDRVACLAESLDGSILERAHRAQESVPNDPDHAAELVASLVHEMQQRTGRTAVGIGVCLPGTTRPSGSLDAPVLGWSDVPITRLVEDALRPAQVEIVVADIAAAATLGIPAKAGEYPSRAHIQFGPGMGLGLCDAGLGARLRPEAKGVAHIAWPGATTPCWCGAIGCLDTVLGLRAVAGDLCSQAGIMRPDTVTELGPLVDVAEQRDPASVAAWREDLAGRIAWVVRLVAQFERPDVISLGGYACQLDDQFEADLRSRLTPEKGIPPEMSVLRLTSDDTSMIGVAKIAGNAVLDSPLTVLRVMGNSRNP